MRSKNQKMNNTKNCMQALEGRRATQQTCAMLQIAAEMDKNDKEAAEKEQNSYSPAFYQPSPSSEDENLKLYGVRTIEEALANFNSTSYD